MSRFFLRDLMAALLERGCAVTFLPRAGLLEPPAAPGRSTLVVEDAARMDAAMLEAICRAPGLRVVLAGLPTFALPELLVPLTIVTLAPVVTLEPLSPGTAAAPGSSMSNARVAIATVVLAATWVAVALLWTRAPWAPSEPAPSRAAALQPAIELPPAPGSPPAPAEPAPSAAEQPGGAISAASQVPMPAGEEDRPGIAETEPRSGSEPAPPQPQVGPSPAPAGRQALNVPPAAAIATPPLAEAPRATPPEPAAPSGNAPQLLPDNAPIRVLVSYPPRSAAARQEAAELVRRLRGDGLEASGPAPAAQVAGKGGITYLFAEDRDGTRRVEHDLGEEFGPARLSVAARAEPLPRPGTIEVLVPARQPP